jgi:hypothetical protein
MQEPTPPLSIRGHPGRIRDEAEHLGQLAAFTPALHQGRTVELKRPERRR